MSKGLEKTKEAIKTKAIRAASRNMEESLKDKKKEWTEQSLADLSGFADIFEASCLEEKAYFVFLKSGKVVELGRKKYPDTIEACASFIKRVEKKLEKKVPSANSLVLKRLSDLAELKTILKGITIKPAEKTTKKRKQKAEGEAEPKPKKAKAPKKEVPKKKKEVPKAEEVKTQ